MLATLSMLALSLQLEGGVLDIANPIDDQYVLYHGNGISSGVQMTSPVLGAALRIDGDRFVLTGGWRWMGHQSIDTDIITDHEYLNCRYHGNCSKPFERWYTRETTSEFYASVGVKFHAGKFDIVPTLGLASIHSPTMVELSFPYERIHSINPHYHAGSPSYYYPKRSDDATLPFVGVDVERGHWGVGAYWMQTAILAAQMNDPGIGQHGGMLRVTYRFGL